jgi:hypothetical protein
MAQHTVTQKVDASPDAVWAILSEFGDVSWIPPAGQVDVEGSGPGMRRHIHGTGDKPVVERLVALEPDRRVFSYSIDENNPIPTSTYLAMVTVGASGDGTEVTWKVDYDLAEGASDDEVRGTIELIYGVMAGWLGDAAAP